MRTKIQLAFKGCGLIDIARGMGKMAHREKSCSAEKRVADRFHQNGTASNCGRRCPRQGSWMY